MRTLSRLLIILSFLMVLFPLTAKAEFSNQILSPMQANTDVIVNCEELCVAEVVEEAEDNHNICHLYFYAGSCLQECLDAENPVYGSLWSDVIDRVSQIIGFRPPLGSSHFNRLDICVFMRRAERKMDEESREYTRKLIEKLEE